MTLHILIEELRSSPFNNTSSKISLNLSMKSPRLKNNHISHSTERQKITERGKTSVLQKIRLLHTVASHQTLWLEKDTRIEKRASKLPFNRQNQKKSLINLPVAESITQSTFADERKRKNDYFFISFVFFQFVEVVFHLSLKINFIFGLAFWCRNKRIFII